MNRNLIIFLALNIYLSAFSKDNITAEAFVNEQMKTVEQQYIQMAQKLNDSIKPPRTSINGTVKCVQTADWTSGFFGGSLWYLYEYSKKQAFLEAAKKWTSVLEKEQFNTSTHDLGFMLYCSYGNGYRLTGNPQCKDVLLQGAKSLSKRFNPHVGLIKSWDFRTDMTYPVIIDNMMNLEYLFWATSVSGDSSFYKIAVSHADSTLKNHYRPDYSCYHVVDYDSVSGKVLQKKTHQGAFDGSSWARGQAWGLYGYTLMYRETKNRKYLDQAINIANYILSKQPVDTVVYWDYNVFQNDTEQKDASASAITSSALFELCNYVNDDMGIKYYKAAEAILKCLSSPTYFAKTGENANFILKHSVGNKPAKSEIDVPLIYADYYYIEALLRYKKQKQGL
jgi:unsaturated chondroitin disaccharide hydrolase